VGRGGRGGCGGGGRGGKGGRGGVMGGGGGEEVVEVWEVVCLGKVLRVRGRGCSWVCFVGVGMGGDVGGGCFV